MSRLHGQCDLSGRTALVLGATGPLGSACSLILHAAGAVPILHGRRPEALRALSESLPGSLWIPHSFEQGDPAPFLEKLEAFPHPDIFVCALGPFHMGPLSETRSGLWSELCALDLALPGALVSALLPGMASRGWGRILLFGSTRGDQARGFRRTAAYASAKAGLAVLTRSVALECSDKGVSCTLVCPGVISDSEERAPESGRWRAFPASLVAEESLRLALHPQALYNGAIVAMDGGMDIP